MPRSPGVMDYENVNGVNLSLNIESRKSLPKSLLITVTYKSNVKKKTWPIQSLVLAIIFNILALCYVRISMRTMFIILIVLAFIIFFWVTHSVQSGIFTLLTSKSTVERLIDLSDIFCDKIEAWPNDGEKFADSEYVYNSISQKMSLRSTSLSTVEMILISESILVIPTVGIQMSVKYVIGKEDTFVPWPSIDDVIINEVIKLNRVLYFLTVLVKVNQSNHETESIKLIPLFKYTKPRLLMLERIYTELQALLSERLPKISELASGDKA